VGVAYDFTTSKAPQESANWAPLPVGENRIKKVPIRSGDTRDSPTAVYVTNLTTVRGSNLTLQMEYSLGKISMEYVYLLQQTI